MVRPMQQHRKGNVNCRLYNDKGVIVLWQAVPRMLFTFELLERVDQGHWSKPPLSWRLTGTDPYAAQT